MSEGGTDPSTIVTRPLGFDLLLVTDPDTPLGVVEGCTAALRGAEPGRVAVSLRAKSWTAGPLLEAARALRRATRAAGAGLMINDRVDVALAVDADGVQLPEAGLPPAAARRLLGRRACLGVSRHDAAGVGAAAGADFVLLAPVFHVPGKGEGLGVDALARLVAAAPAPVVALGGVGPREIPPVLAAGVAAVAMRRAVFSAADPGREVRRALAAIDAVRGTSPGRGGTAWA